MAEAELLAPLAQLLMPQTLPLELFRSFPSPPGWAGNYLEPDLAAHGVLKDPQAALFIEYDGYWRHGEKAGIDKDQLKNAALLDFAPIGSKVIRISHTVCKPVEIESDETVLWICVDTWREGNSKKLLGAFNHVLAKMLDALEEALDQKTLEHLQMQRRTGTVHVSNAARGVAEAAAIARGGNSIKEISTFLGDEGYSRKNVNLMLKGSLSGWRCIETKLKPKLHWLRHIGLSHDQVAKVVAGFPAILGLSVEQNLKPTVDWLLGLGLSKTQVAKAVAIKPQILGYSIEHNLKPTVGWLLDLGLSNTEVAKAVAAHPSILGYSIHRNLKPTVQWMLDLGLSKTQVAKAVATSPSTLGYSIEGNLKPTVEWVLDLGLSKSQVAKVVAAFPAILGYSIEQNLKPTIQWLLDVGLSNSEVATAVASFPNFLGLNVDNNLQPKYVLLLAAFGPSGAGQLIAKCPRILSYSQRRLNERLSVLANRNEAQKLASAMCLATPAFEKRVSR